MNILITGTGGFIGSNVLWYLANFTSHKLICLDSFKFGMKSNAERLKLALKDIPNSRYTVMEWDLTHDFSQPFVNQLLQHNVDVILNIASDSHVTRSISNPAACWFNNCTLIYNMLELSRKLKPKAFIQISTDEVYGDAGWDGPGHPEWDAIVPSNPYSASKAAQEALAISYFRTYHVPLVLTNTMNVIGQWQDPEKFLPKMIKRILNDEVITLHADNIDATPKVATRVWLDVKNMACALSFIISNLDKLDFNPRQRPPRFHLVGDVELSVLELTRIVASLLDKEPKYELVQGDKERPGYDRRYALVDNNLKAMGYSHPIPLQTTLNHIVDWVIANPNWVYE